MGILDSRRDRICIRLESDISVSVTKAKNEMLLGCTLL